MHEHHDDLAERYSQQTWDARYSADRVWSGNPNVQLVAEASGLPPGDALDVGAGEGADAVWLAERGWRVTALDVSPVALERVAAHAEQAGVADRVTTLHHDLLGGAKIPGTYDLVSAQFWHPPVERRADFDSVIGAALRRGGTLLVVGHHPSDFDTGARDPHGHRDLLYTPEEIVAALPAERWEIRAAEARTRPFDRPDGPVTVTDSVVVAIRR